jgi:hypothetical protein
MAPLGGGRGDVGGADEVEQMGSFGVVELQCTCDSFEDVFGRAGCVAPLEAGVVLDADASEHRGLLAPQAFHSPVAAVGGKSSLLGCDLRPPGGEELTDVIPGVHALHTKAG